MRDLGLIILLCLSPGCAGYIVGVYCADAGIVLLPGIAAHAQAWQLFKIMEAVTLLAIAVAMAFAIADNWWRERRRNGSV